MTDHETVRLTAHTLLDALSAFDDLSSPDADAAIRTALRRLEDIDAVAIVYDDETDTRTVDIQPVLHAALQLLTSLIVSRLGDHPELTGLDEVARLREVVDTASRL